MIPVITRTSLQGGEVWGAVFSADKDNLFRFKLWRTWNVDRPPCMFIGINPSTANEKENDRTVARCALDARRWGCGSLVMMNLLPYRATKIEDMKAYYNAHPDCESIFLNRSYLVEEHLAASVRIAAWGSEGSFLGRAEDTIATLRDLDCLKHSLRTTHPWHPLYLPHGVLYPIPYARGGQLAPKCAECYEPATTS